MIRLRQDLSRDSILDLVKEKKSKVGGGFLTDQGALFLVSTDLGISLKPFSTTRKLSSVAQEDTEVSIIARLLSIGPARTFTRKSNSTQGFVSKLVLYDSSFAKSVSIWNKELSFQIISSGLAPGDPLRISGAYSRKSPDGSSVSLSISDRGEVTKLYTDELIVDQIPSVTDRAVDIGKISANNPNPILIAKGKVASATRIGEFNRKDGTKSSYIAFALKSAENNDQSSSLDLRVVLWDNTNPLFEKLKIGETVTLLNVKPKVSEFQGSKAIELHGDETTSILERWQETRVWLESTFSSTTKELAKTEISKNSQQKIGSKPLPFVARVISLGQDSRNEQTSTSRHLLLIDSSKRKLSVTTLGEAAYGIENIAVDDVVVCKADSFDEIGLKVTCSMRGAITKVKPERNDIPKSSTLVSQIDKLEPNSIVNLDCMVISAIPTRDIQTKEGLVRRSEAIVADPSGEIKVFAWRGLAKSLEALSPGLRLWLRAIEVQSHEGKKFLVFKNYTRIETSS